MACRFSGRALRFAAGFTVVLGLSVGTPGEVRPNAVVCSVVGDDATPPQPSAIPERIVSTSPSITEILFALGVGHHVVGVSTYCRYPAVVATLPKVGTFWKPDAETIARLRPDLVYMHAGPHSVASQLTALGIGTVVVDRGTLSSVFATIRQISRAAGVAERGACLLSELTAGLDRVKASVAGRAPRKVLIIVGRRTGTLMDITAAGPGSYLHDLAAIAGGENVLASVALEYPRISMETMISLAPDIIIDVGEMGETPEDSEWRRLVTERLWQGQTLVKAVREQAVHVVHDDAFVLAGPRVLTVAQTMAKWFHGVEPEEAGRPPDSLPRSFDQNREGREGRHESSLSIACRPR